MMSSIIELFQYQFFQNAGIIAILTSISCGIIGTYIVSRRIVFISGGITHASFGGIGIGYFASMNPVIGAAIFGVLSALGIEYFSRKTDIRQDSVIAMLWSFGIAIGVIFIFITPGYAPNLMTYLFGSILTVTQLDILLSLLLTIAIIIFFALFFKIILFISFDEEYAKTHEAPVGLINYLLIGLVALTIVFNIRVVGIILVLSLLTIPQNTANIFTKDFKKIIYLSILFGLTGTFGGLISSYFLEIPSGASIIFFLVLIFVLLKTFKWLSTKIAVNKHLS